MKRVIAGVAAVFVFTAGQAAAEGLAPPSRIAAPVQPGPNWNGFYLGVGIGAGALSQDLSGDHNWQTKECEIIKKKFWWTWIFKKKCYNVSHHETFDESDTGDIGVFGIVTVGFDRVLRPGWVGGLFADYDFASNLSADVSFPHYNGSLDHNYSWAVGGRLGYLVTPSTLVYATGGYTQAEFDVSDLGSTTFEGYFVGGGVETFLRDNWTLKLEYRYSDFSSETLLDTAHTTVELEPSIHSARLVLSYKFGHRSGGGSIKD